MTETVKKPIEKSIVKKQAKPVEKEPSVMEIFTKGIFKENGIFVMVLGLCPALAVTDTFEGAFGMGILVMIILTLTNTTVSAIRKFVPNAVRIPSYVVIIATEVTMLKMTVDAFAPDLATKLGIFISLITVNCVVFGRAESFASKNTVPKAIADGFGVALGFMLGLSLIGFTREFFGTGAIKIGYILPLNFQTTLRVFNAEYGLSVLTSSPGAFLVIGLLLAIITAFGQAKKGGKKK
ncbi:MAG: electron transport complex subunit RsxE [Acholeplasmataceae bacterium]|nr:electron transport complex subunit RsxE [Acholeplasmataceae bacterium]